jgi:phage recombination protein Bet
MKGDPVIQANMPRGGTAISRQTVLIPYGIGSSNKRGRKAMGETKEVAIQNQRTEIAITEQTLFNYLDAFGLATQLDNKEKTQFVEIAKAYQLNPFKREIYCIAYGQGEKRKLSIITGYEVYLKRAERTEKLRGWKAWTEGTYIVETSTKEVPTKAGGTWKKQVRVPVGDLKAIVEIRRADWTDPFVHEVYLDEYSQDNDMWANKPRTMLKKVAIAQAFRMCFPDEFGGMPYTQDELSDGQVITHSEDSVEDLKKKAATLSAELGISADEKKKIFASAAGDMAAIVKELENRSKPKHVIKQAKSDDIEFTIETEGDVLLTSDQYWDQLTALMASPDTPTIAKKEIAEANAEDEKDPVKLKALLEKVTITTR